MQERYWYLKIHEPIHVLVKEIFYLKRSPNQFVDGISEDVYFFSHSRKANETILPIYINKFSLNILHVSFILITEGFRQYIEIFSSSRMR